MTTPIGPRLRALRHARAMTLDALAETVGLHKAYLSRLERGLKTPSIATVLRLTAAFAVPVAELFGESLPADAVRVTRAAPVPVPQAGETATVQPLGQAAGALAAFVCHPGPEFSAADVAEHAGEELLFVLAGTIELRFADRSILLDTGDCAQFCGTLAHQLRRIGDAPAAALVAVAGPLPAPLLAPSR